MIVLDTDIVTLLSYGRNEKLRQRIAAVEEGEELAITIITYGDPSRAVRDPYEGCE